MDIGQPGNGDRTPQGAGGLTIRVAEPSDAPAMARLFQASFAPVAAQLGYRPSPMDRSFVDALDARLVLAAQRAESDAAIGFMAATATPVHLYVDAIAVAPSAQGSGVGAALLAATEDLAAALCLPRVRLDTDPALGAQMRFYERAGYREIRRFSAGGGARVRYAKRVETALERLLRSER